MSEKKNSSIGIALLLVLIIGLIITVMILAIYIIQMKNDKKEEPENSIAKINNEPDGSNVEDNDNIEQEIQALDINSNLVQDLLYPKIMVDGTEYYLTDGKSFYKNSKVDYSSLSNVEKIVVILNNTKDLKEVIGTNEKIDILKKTKMFGNRSDEELRELIRLENVGRIVAYENVGEVAQRCFENINDIEWESYDNGVGTTYEYVDGNYYMIGYEGGGLGSTTIGYSRLEKAEQNEDYIYLYDKFLWQESLDYLVYDGTVKIYDSSDETNLIGEENEFLPKEDLNKRMDKYYDKLNTYKHTFKKDSNGNYYWISTEPEELNQTVAEKDYEDIVLDGSYAIPNTDSGWDFTKDGRAAESGNVHVNVGTYRTIGENSVEVHYTQNVYWNDATGEKEISTIDSYDYLTIEDGKVYWTNPNNDKVLLDRYGDTDYFEKYFEKDFEE